MYYGFEYFCGANIIVEISGMPILECSGLAYSENESKRPVYGYSSRFFDATARGQCIVQGELVINYVHQDYLFRAMEMGLDGVPGGGQAPEILAEENSRFGGDTLPDSELREILSNEQTAHEVFDVMTQDPANLGMAQEFRNLYWLPPLDERRRIAQRSYNPHDLAGRVTIRVTFGERNPLNGYTGKTGSFISGVEFTGRGKRIMIDESVCVESYPFFGRRLHTLVPEEMLASVITDPTTGDIEYNTNPQPDLKKSTSAGFYDGPKK